jgi:DNA polymerase-3 subunit epsilon
MYGRGGGGTRPDDTFLADKPIMATVATNFLEFLGDDTLVIHNAEFDLKFINAELRRVGYKTLTNPVVDTVLMARKKYPGQPANLDALCRRFKIDLSERTLHGALLDAQLLADVYLEMKGGRQQGLELMDAPAAAMTIAATMTAAHTPRVPRVFTVSDAERAAHAALVQTLGDQALWRKY